MHLTLNSSRPVSCILLLTPVAFRRYVRLGFVGSSACHFNIVGVRDEGELSKLGDLLAITRYMTSSSHASSNDDINLASRLASTSLQGVYQFV
jgi:hypothetical protein